MRPDHTPAAQAAAPNRRAIAQIMEALETESDSTEIARLHAALERARHPRPAPPRRSPPPASPDDARAQLKALVEADARPGVSFASLSRMLGRRARFLEVFVREGHPLRLAARDRTLLATFLRVGEHELGEVADG